ALRDVRANLELTRLPDAERWAMAEGRFVHWTTAPGLSSGTRALGAGVPRWLLRDGALVHLPGHGDDYLILNTPLRGDFEVSAELKLQGWQEMHVRYGSCEFELSHDRKNYRLHTTMQRSAAETLILPPLAAGK